MECRPKSYQWCTVSADVWEVGMPCRSFFLGGGLHRLQLVGCSKYPLVFPFEMFSYALRGSNMLCEDVVLGHNHREGFGCNGQVLSAFPSACGDTSRQISVVDISVLKPGAYARLADDFAKALLEIQDAKGIAPAPAQVTAALLGTTVWWKLRSYCQACNSGTESTGHTLAKPVGVSVLRCPASQVSRQLLRFQLLQDDANFLKMGATKCLEHVNGYLAHWISQLARCPDMVGTLTT